MGEAIKKKYVQKALTDSEEKRFFHWEQEFPEVFYDEHGNRKGDAGFDAVIGKEPPPSGLFEREISVEPVQRLQVKTETRKDWASEDGKRKSAMMSAQRVREMLKKNPRLQLQFERGNTDKVVEKIKNSQEVLQEE